MKMLPIKKAKASGYFVDMYFVGVENVEIAIKRVADRVRRGGHGVEEKDIRRRYVKSQKNLIKAIPICDEIKIYDNTFSFIRLASFSNGNAQFGHHELSDSWFRRLLQENE